MVIIPCSIISCAIWHCHCAFAVQKIIFPGSGEKYAILMQLTCSIAHPINKISLIPSVSINS